MPQSRRQPKRNSQSASAVAAASNPQSPLTKYTPYWVVGLLFSLVLIAYLPSLHGGLLWDDEAHVTKPDLRSLNGLYRIWFELGATQQYYPLLHTAFWIEHELWGDNTLGYHLINILQHATVASLLYFVLRHLNIPGALLAATVFSSVSLSVSARARTPCL